MTDLRTAAEAARDAYARDYPMRTADMHRENCDCLRCAMDALTAALDADGWRPIETAPKDGTSILVCDVKSDSVDQVEWSTEFDDDGMWHATGGKRKTGNSLGYQAKLWMPLPRPPKGCGHE